MCKNQKMIERNYSIDILKFICAILVVFLHTDCVYIMITSCHSHVAQCLAFL